MPWSAGRSPRDLELAGTGWDQARQARLELDGYRCQIRGPRCTGHATHVDHSDQATSRTDHRLEVLRSACQPCHMGRTARQSHDARSPRVREPERHPGKRA